MALSYMEIDSRYQFSQLDSHHKMADPVWDFSIFQMIMGLMYENTPIHDKKMGNVP